MMSFFFYGCLKLRFPDVEINPGPRAVPQCCRVMFTNINGLHGNRDELAIAATKFDVVACAETKVTGRRHVSELLLPGFEAPTLLLKSACPNRLGMALFVRSVLSISRKEKFECSCCEFIVAKIPGQRLNCYLFVVYRSPSKDDRVFDCLCKAMGSIQSVDPKSVFWFEGDFNCHHSEWLGSRITDGQLVNGPTHRASGVLDLVLTNVPDLCNVKFREMLEGRTLRRLELHWIYHQLLLALMYLAGFRSSPELIGMRFVRLYLYLTH